MSYAKLKQSPVFRNVQDQVKAMHFGDTAPLRAVLSKLNDNVVGGNSKLETGRMPILRLQQGGDQAIGGVVFGFQSGLEFHGADGFAGLGADGGDFQLREFFQKAR